MPSKSSRKRGQSRGKAQASRKPRQRTTTRKKPARNGRTRRRSGLVTLVKLTVAAIILWTLIGAGFYVWALTYDLGGIADLPQRSTVLDSEGRFYSRLAGENRVVVDIEEVSPAFLDALVSREDERFYVHHGVDPIGIARAAVRNLLLGGIRQGGSTITQQLARNAYPLGGRTLQRKLIEAALAFRIETELTKQQILEAYINRIYFGSGYYGVETAARAYFGKPSKDLTLSESALLAGLIRSPTRLSPFNDLEAAIRQRNVVLNSMTEAGLITEFERDTARKQPVRLAAKPNSTVRFDWAMETIQRELDLVLTQEQLAEGGLTIVTTLDPELQRRAGLAVRDGLARIEKRPGFDQATSAPVTRTASPFLQGALLAIDNRTGGIRAIIGGRDYSETKFNRATSARRQIGSTVKPFVFAAAFEKGVDPLDRISDARLSRAELPAGHGPYDPANADGKYHAEVRVGEALIQSRNTSSVRVGLQAGLQSVVGLLEQAGLAREIQPVPSLCLGAFETTLKDLTAAYTAFATGGVRRQPYVIAEVLDSQRRPLYKATEASLRILSPKAAESTRQLLDAIVAGDAWGKTGTTNDAQDAWFIGSTSDITAGVWVGFDDPRPILPNATAASLALPIWKRFMDRP